MPIHNVDVAADFEALLARDDVVTDPRRFGQHGLDDIGLHRAEAFGGRDLCHRHDMGQEEVGLCDGRQEWHRNRRSAG